jgi:eukaryotic-like serine/threonine-protein kinase
MVVTNQQAVLRPRIVGRYALFDEIAAGGMATIHLGRLVGPVGFSRTVAIKTLHPQFAKDPEFVEMFLEEARLASRIQHPNVISTVDVATTEGEVFLVMEYVAGESLAKLVRSALKRGERMPVEVAATVLAGMLHGLHATHEAKNEQLEPMHIVHRDVSPQNVLVGLDGIARIFDFGVAKAAAMRSQATSDGQMKGKLSYMSPEQLNSRAVDRRTDIFAAGVVAWECLVGRRLFAGSDPGEVLAKVLTLDIPAPIDVQNSIPRAVSNTVMRALERSPEQRWQTAKEFAIELERTVVLAAAHVVGDWVALNAGEALQDRRHRVEAVERASVDLGHVGIYASGVSTSDLVSPPSSRSLPQGSDGGELSSAASATTHSSNLTVTSTAASARQSMARQLAFTLLVGACGAGLVGAMWFWQQRNAITPDTDRSPAVLPEPPAESHSNLTPEPARSARPERGGPEKEAVLPPPVLEIESLPEQAEAADAGAARPAAVRSPAAAWRALHPPSRNRKGGKRGLKSAASPARAEGAPPAAAGKDARVPPALIPVEATEKPASDAPKSECEPPWYIDPKGIQRLKPKCL